MAYHDPEVDPVPHVPDAAWVPAPPDWRRLYEQALERAEAAEARAEELKSAELAARSKAGTYKSLFEAARRKPLAAVEDAKEARRAAKNAFALQAEVRRLHRLLDDVGVESGRYSVMGVRREVARLRSMSPLRRTRNAGAVAVPQGRDDPAVEAERAAAAEGRETAATYRNAGDGDREAARDPGGAVEAAVRAREREAGEAAHRTPARPAARRARP